MRGFLLQGRKDSTFNPGFGDTRLSERPCGFNVAVRLCARQLNYLPP
jgi:hypothetical protein